MNQKLRMARSGIVILFAILCVVCLSLSLILSARFAAYAEDANSVVLKENDGKGHDLWLVYYEGENDGESLWDGVRNDSPISYIDGVQNEQGLYPVREGGADEINMFAPYRGKDLTLKLNPAYETADGTLGSLYDLDNAEYNGNVAMGEATRSTNMATEVTVAPLNDDGSLESLVLSKNWVIATLCNTVNASSTYIGDRAYASSANYALLRPTLGNVIVYDITSPGYRQTIAVQYVDDQTNYFQAGTSDGGYFLSRDENDEYIPWNQADLESALSDGVNLIEYYIKGLDALEATADSKAYTLTITAMDVTNDGILYVQSGKSYDFNVSQQSLGNDENDTFDTIFDVSFTNKSAEYTEGNECIDSLGLELRLHGVLLKEGVDYSIDAESHNVGYVDLRIIGMKNLTGFHTISGAKENVRITPARNELKKLNIISWMYGTYNPQNNLIIATTKYLTDPNDITFSIVRLVKGKDDKVTEEKIDALKQFHYYVDPSNGQSSGIVTDDVIAELSKLPAGDYRLYVTVAGVDASNPDFERNYQPIEETGIDFSVFVGINRWKAGVEPTVKDGGWVEGKLDSVEDLINAESEHGSPILMIYDIEGKRIYSNLPEHANLEIGDINVLKTLKAGRYYLSAEVEETGNYSGLKTNTFFTVAPNNLPVWAVILIVAGSLGIVALVFGILHQKGILQMLTGKVLLSMRTRANVDATLAAIRAAKVAREAEASIAAAKAREAEEQAKADKSEDK